MRIYVLISAGGMIGSVLRYALSQWIQSRSASLFPAGTLAVNLLGCFAIGLIFAYFEKGSMSAEWRWFLATGICGGFTTFSAFSHETILLMRGGQWLYAGTYIIASVILGLLATYIGMAIVKAV